MNLEQFIALGESIVVEDNLLNNGSNSERLENKLVVVNSKLYDHHIKSTFGIAKVFDIHSMTIFLRGAVRIGYVDPTWIIDDVVNVANTYTDAKVIIDSMILKATEVVPLDLGQLLYSLTHNR